MKHIINFVLFLSVVSGDYFTQRNNIKKMEQLQYIGGNLTITDDEELAVNRFLMTQKSADYANFDEEKFLPLRSFSEVKNQIEDSILFRTIKSLPKGSSLHTHILAAVDVNFLIKNLTYRNDLYLCNKPNGQIKLKIFNEFIPINNTECEYSEINAFRLEMGPDVFDKWLASQLTITKSDNTKSKSWTKMSSVFRALYEFLTCREIFEVYFYQALEELYQDRVLYAEFRGNLMQFYDLNGTSYDKIQTLDIIQKIASNFTTTHANFVAAKYIYSAYRKQSVDNIQDSLKWLHLAAKKFPNFVVGYDLIGYEDLGEPLEKFARDLNKVDKSLRFYLHAGETNWNGNLSDWNVLDAALLGSSRIGHALTLYKHPEVMRLVKRQRSAVEISPVSNQMLKYVRDLRMHPAVYYITQGIPVVICNDDPLIFGNSGLSYDFYLTFLAMTDEETDLRFLKETALNSIVYSAMHPVERNKALQIFERQWKAAFEEFVMAVHKVVERFGIFLRNFG